MTTESSDWLHRLRGSWVAKNGFWHKVLSQAIPKEASVKHKTIYFQYKLSPQNSPTILILLFLGVFTVPLPSITPRILPVPWLCQFPYYSSQTPGRVHRHRGRENIMMPCK